MLKFKGSVIVVWSLSTILPLLSTKVFAVVGKNSNHESLWNVKFSWGKLRYDSVMLLVIILVIRTPPSIIVFPTVRVLAIISPPAVILLTCNVSNIVPLLEVKAFISILLALILLAVIFWVTNKLPVISVVVNWVVDVSPVCKMLPANVIPS